MESEIRIRTEFWPVALVTYVGQPDAPMFDDYLHTMSGWLARREPYALVFDASEAGLVTAGLRRRQARWMHENQAALRQFNLGAAFVFTSPMVRAVYQAILWLQPVPCPQAVFQSLGDAVLWTGERLQQANIPLPVGLMQAGVSSR
jgi:hypothetical protein